MGERASNLFGVLLSLTFFSVLLAVMLVAVSILPDAPSLAPPTLPGETRSEAVRTPQPIRLGELGLVPAPVLVPTGAALASVTFATGAVPAPAGPSGPGGGVVQGPVEGPPRRPGLSPDDGIRTPGSTRRDGPDKGQGRVHKKDESGHPKRGPAFLRCDEESAPGKGRAKGRCDGPGTAKPGGAGGGGRGGGSGKGGSSGGAIGGGGSGHGGSSQGSHGSGLGRVKAKTNGHGNGHANGHGKGHGKGR